MDVIQLKVNRLTYFDWAGYIFVFGLLGCALAFSIGF